MLDRAIRYLVPFVTFFIIYIILYYILFRSSDDILMRLESWGAGLIFMSPAVQKDATGFIILWFLPTFFTLVTILIFVNQSARWLKTATLILSLAVHCSIGAWPAIIKTYVPFGFHTALYILPLGLAIHWLWSRIHSPKDIPLVGLVAWIVFISTYYSLLHDGVRAEVPRLILPTILEPWTMIRVDLMSVSWFFAIGAVAEYLSKVPILVLLGRYSLIVYLCHPLLFKPVFAILQLIHTSLAQLGALGYLTEVTLSVVITVCLALALAISIEHFEWCRNLVTPRTFRHWQRVRWF